MLNSPGWSVSRIGSAKHSICTGESELALQGVHRGCVLRSFSSTQSSQRTRSGVPICKKRRLTRASPRFCGVRMTSPSWRAHRCTAQPCNIGALPPCCGHRPDHSVTAICEPALQQQNISLNLGLLIRCLRHPDALTLPFTCGFITIPMPRAYSVDHAPPPPSPRPLHPLCKSHLMATVSQAT